jgi:hypothetical protein
LCELQRHVASELDPCLADGLDKVDAIGDEHRAFGAGHRVDCSLNGRGVVGAAVAHGTLVLDVDDKVGDRRGRATLRRAGTRLQRQPRQAESDCAGEQSESA